MHQYLKAVGFGKIKSRKELYEILSDVENKFTYHELVYMEEEMDFCEYQREYGAGIGISLYGDIDINEYFRKQYYCPFFIGTGITSYADIIIDRRMDRESYIGICEDTKIGISLIFHMQNTLEYLKERELTKDKVKYTSVTLSGLCNSGTILLPIKKDKLQVRKQKEEVTNRMLLMDAAKNGDPVAIESLTLDDIDTYSEVSRRLVTEDVFSIVDTYIMPYGVECDQYSILGEILDCSLIKNGLTEEDVYLMTINCNAMIFDLCINKEDVYGEPGVGRRFTGTIRMQGYINFPN